jgi:hypothetical protein
MQQGFWIFHNKKTYIDWYYLPKRVTSVKYHVRSGAASFFGIKDATQAVQALSGNDE